MATLAEHQWTVLTLPGRYFSWRIRGNSMSWAFGEHAATLAAHYDLVIATSMTDLSALRGFVPSLGNIPTLVYFHENQFDYPSTANARANVEPQILNLYTALAADQLAFNSRYNFDTFISGARALLKKLPDQVPENVLELIEKKSTILPVPLLDVVPQQVDSTVSWQCYENVSSTDRPLLIAWAARWEYDKGPDRLLAIIEQLERSGIDYRLCILGQKFRQVPEEFAVIKHNFSHRIDQFGFAQSAQEYQQWLSCADVFLSTAVHEFQGLAVLEATDAGCIPLLPDRLVYSELFPARCLYPCAAKLKVEAANAVTQLLNLWRQIQQQTFEPVAINSHWSDLSDSYRQLLQTTATLKP